MSNALTIPTRNSNVVKKIVMAAMGLLLTFSLGTSVTANAGGYNYQQQPSVQFGSYNSYNSNYTFDQTTSIHFAESVTKTDYLNYNSSPNIGCGCNGNNHNQNHSYNHNNWKNNY